jgi:hypothetical protein
MKNYYFLKKPSVLHAYAGKLDGEWRDTGIHGSWLDIWIQPFLNWRLSMVIKLSKKAPRKEKDNYVVCETD